MNLKRRKKQKEILKYMRSENQKIFKNLINKEKGLKKEIM